jgi:hypothetical protein
MAGANIRFQTKKNQFNSSDAEELDKSSKLKFLLIEKIKEGLKVVGLDGKEILKKL